MGISIRAYARHRGVSDAAVRKAIKTGRLTAEADGSINAARADSEWQRHTDPAQQRPRVGPRPPGGRDPGLVPASTDDGAHAPSGAGLAGGASPGSFLQARTVNEVVKAQTGRVRLAKLKGELVDRAEAVAQVYRLARQEREGWLNWPARVAPQLALTLGADLHALHAALEAAVREHLLELGEIRPRLN